MSVVCLKAYREFRSIQEPECGVVAVKSVPLVGYSRIRNQVEARFGDQLPKHFAYAMSKPQDQPYKYGDVHNVSYRPKGQRLWNKPYPVPCEVTIKSCRRDEEGCLVLGSRCLEGIDEPFPCMDMKYQVSLSFLQSLPNDTKLKIWTRADLIAHDYYIQELNRLDVSVTILAPAESEGWLRENEPGAPSLLRRSQAVSKLRECGIVAWMHNHEVSS